MPHRPFFLPAADPRAGQRFCLFHPARGEQVRGRVVYVHPFAEEMNKARRMASLQSRSLAAAGYAVLQIDLHGCGDSSGDFGDATWQGWIDDVALACAWLAREAPRAPLWLWGLRAGCLLVVEAARQRDLACNFLFWHPPSSGKPLLQQFMRLKLAGDALNGRARGAMDSMRRQLEGGSAIEVAGYRVSPALAAGLEAASLAPPARPSRMEWLEISTLENASASPATRAAWAQWEQAGAVVGSHIVRGPAFWQTTEIEEAPELLHATLEALAGVTHRAGS